MSEINSRCKRWVFVVNNFTEEEEKHIVHAHPDPAEYIVFGREVAPSTGTPHLQGYLELKVRTRGTALKKVLGFERAKLIPAKGTAEQNRVYATKDGDFVEFGTPVVVGAGRRTDLVAFREGVDGGADEVQIAEDHFAVWARHPELFHRYKRLKCAKQAREVRVVFLWGLPGTGKTRGVFESYPDVWINSDPSLQWFDGYNGESVVLLDDYRGGASDAFILKLLDRYPLQVAIKGGFRPWLATTVFITSNEDPRLLHAAVSAAFMRRIHSVHHLQGNLYAAGCEAQLAVYLRVIQPLAVELGEPDDSQVR